MFDAVKQHLDESCTPEQISQVTWVPVDAIEELANDIAANPAATLFVEGMGPNLRPGHVATGAFAVWSGGAGEVGSRKAPSKTVYSVLVER